VSVCWVNCGGYYVVGGDDNRFGSDIEVDLRMIDEYFVVVVIVNDNGLVIG
jgi:hypothetical protein